MEIRNQFGQIDLSAIDPTEVSKLSDEAQLALSKLISSVQDREAAQQRFNSAVLAVRLATQEQMDALAAHQVGNPPMSFEESHAASVAAFNRSIPHGL